MTPGESDWWSLNAPDAGPGSDYSFVVDDGHPTPDPRSAWQPYGVHGPSRVSDASRFVWSDDDWLGLDARGKLFYEVHIGTFTAPGTLDAAIERLDHLVDLGVDVVELMPVAAFPGQWGWGYDGVALYAVHEAYGGPTALQRFVDAAHARGLAVCLDVVYNHLGPSGNYLGVYGHYFTNKHHTPWGSAVNLDDDGCEHVRRFLCDNALRWMRDFHIDALRLDAVHELRDDSTPHILAQLSDETDSLATELGRTLTLIAESDLNDARMVMPTQSGGYGIHAQWDDDFHHALHSLLTGEKQGYYADFGDLTTVAHVLRHVFFHDGSWSAFREKNWGATVDTAVVGGHRFVAYASNHDQVGNRALGDRPSSVLSTGQQAISAALTLTSPFTPMLFMGEEWSASTPFLFFTDHPETELGEAVRHGRRAEFSSHGWAADDIPDPQDHETRNRSVLDWSEIGNATHTAMLAWYRQLIQLRRDIPDLLDDDLRLVTVEVDDDASTLVVGRGSIRVLVNLSGTTQHLPLQATSRVRELLTWGTFSQAGGSASLSGESVSIVGLE